VLLGGEYYRLFTAMFLHIEPAHIFFNGYALYIIGSYIERLFGHARFIVIYFLGGLTGSILMTILNYVDNVSGIGASGALFAIFGAEMVYLIRHRDILGKAASAQLRSLLFLLAINLVIGLLPGSRIGMWAHVGGLIGGLVLTWFISPRFIASPHPAVEGSQVADDTNPLDTKYWIVSLYLIVLVGMLTIVTLIARG
jgi:rhomboid protease GluP